ncbi:carbohydrate ABC transporter permease [Rhizohabitans arisaemae]|uniref:carbohydrate ABC transporter permease n=1 Tax=Rhizohabitans arisaemae TaxID=2720610 RepID=UPI0024B238D9|nr:sugar ABC transporter permease [Rhizohabitans arisaemae]
MKLRRRRWPLLYLTLLPTFVLLAVFSYYPAINGIVRSFFDWHPGGESPFVWLENYGRMLTDDLWWGSFRNLGFIFVWSVTMMWVFPLIAAELLVMLSTQRLRFVFRTLLLVPLAFPAVVNVLLWSFIYNPRDGMLNTFLREVGLGFLAHNWVGDPDTALVALLFVQFPWVASLPFLVFSSALEDIPKEVFEAAELDGAGRLRRFWHIDLPLMTQQFKLLLVLSIIGTLQYGLQAALVTGGGPDDATQVPVLKMISAAFNANEWGYAATLSTTLFLLTLAISGIALVMTKRGARDGVE